VNINKNLSKDLGELTVSDMSKLYAAKKYKELTEIIPTILKKNPKDIEVLNILALSYKQIGNSIKAEELFIQFLNMDIKDKFYHYVYSNAGNLFYDTGKVEKALSCHNFALQLNPNNLNSLNQVGLCLSNKGDDKAAISYFKKALEIDHKEASAHINLANSARNLGLYKEASDHYAFSDQPLAKCQEIECLYLLGDRDSFNKKLLEFSKLNKPHPLAASLSSHASIRYDQEDIFSFCNKPFEFVESSNLYDLKDFNDNLIKEFFNCLNSLKISKKTQSLLKNGYQSSGNIFLIDLPPIQILKNIVINKINNYRKKYNDGSATFLSQWPEDYVLYGWIIVMDNGGNLSGHMHKEGWLSGSLYLERPEKNQENDGDIIFSLHGSNYPREDKEFPFKIVDIDKGDMVLFPSSLFHATIPFNSNKKRITLAFDIIPKV
tara:strand:- start:3307 stop:4608 length:1302 start_codon:yes stop_codon:yes gene_type:complete